jgi:hypothetical protein
MFQYAFGRALEEKLNTKLKFDLTFFSNQNENKDLSFRDYELENFNVRVTKASLCEINHFKSYGKNRILRQIFKLKRRLISSGTFLMEQNRRKKNY